MSRRLVLFRRGVHNLWRIWQNRSVSVCVSVYLILLIHFKISVHRKYIGSARAGVQCKIFNSALWPSLQSMLKLDVYQWDNRAAKHFIVFFNMFSYNFNLIQIQLG